MTTLYTIKFKLYTLKNKRNSRGAHEFKSHYQIIKGNVIKKNKAACSMYVVEIENPYRSVIIVPEIDVISIEM